MFNSAWLLGSLKGLTKNVINCVNKAKFILFILRIARDLATTLRLTASVTLQVR